MAGQTIKANFSGNGKLTKAIQIAHAGWQRVLYAHECEPCDMCEEPVCTKCEMHYADCNCPGPHQDDEYEYETFDGDEYARRLTHA